MDWKSPSEIPDKDGASIVCFSGGDIRSYTVMIDKCGTSFWSNHNKCDYDVEEFQGYAKDGWAYVEPPSL